MSDNFDNENNVYLKLASYDDDQEDCDFFKSMYPVEIAHMQKVIEDKCNELEYAGSMMFDKYPDRVRVEKMSKDICREGTDFDEKLIQVMLVNEMLRRRIRKRNCYGVLKKYVIE